MTTNKKGKALKIVIVIVVILAVIGVGFKFFIYGKLKEKAFNMVTKDMVQQMLDENSRLDNGVDIDEVVRSVSQEDKEKIEKMIVDSVPLSDVPKVLNMVRTGEVQELKDYAKDNFTDEQIMEMKEIYKKYMN